MPSIFDVPVTARIFNASDWLAAIDVQLQAPPSAPAAEAEQIADAWPTDEPPIDEPLTTWDTQPATPRRLRNLPYALLAWLVSNSYISFGLYRILLAEIAAGRDMTLENLILPVLLVLAITTLALLFWLGLAWRFNRL